ncbi:MAG: SDR family oxidoreductase [Bacteroidota bacterium]
MHTNFKRQTAIITGAGQGIGFGVAKALLEQGANVLLNDLDAALAEQAANKLNELQKGKCIPHTGDASQPEVIDDIIHSSIHQFGTVDIVVANAGITIFKPFIDFELADFQKIMAVNLQGSFFLTQAAAKVMQQQENGGQVLLLSSIVGQRAFPNSAAYAMSKAALSMMARTLVIELSPLGIRINAIAPGATVTERTQENNPDYASTWRRHNPDGQVATPEDIAETALFLLSSAARHINGQTITVDGGWTGVGNHPKEF